MARLKWKQCQLRHPPHPQMTTEMLKHFRCDDVNLEELLWWVISGGGEGDFSFCSLYAMGISWVGLPITLPCGRGNGPQILATILKGLYHEMICLLFWHLLIEKKLKKQKMFRCSFKLICQLTHIQIQMPIIKEPFSASYLLCLYLSLTASYRLCLYLSLKAIYLPFFDS